ncbi:hypothetical protein AB0J90_16995 [Micromonospora sp. NPDC049523]|uniref:hypothetical protein n=1 Tax=Micromonospora sp. NPDC049523 TaxID=3155921 RepID=UPI003432D48D
MTYPYPQQDPWADPTEAHPPPPAHLPPTLPLQLPAEHYPPTPTSPPPHHPPAPPQYAPPPPQYAPAPPQYAPAPPHPPAQQYAPAQPYPQAGVPQPVYAVPVVPAKSTGVAVAWELLPGLLGVFGIGNLYAARVGVGLTLMVSYWVLFWINFGLFFVGIGFVTMPLTWVVYMIIGPLLAARGVAEHNSGIVVR